MKHIGQLEEIIQRQLMAHQKELDERGVRCDVHGVDHLPEEECPDCKADRDKVEKMAATRTALGIPERYHSMSLDNYRAEIDGQKKAVAAIKRMYQGDVMSLIFSGHCGTGKTHLAVALLNRCIDDRAISCRFTTAAKMVRSIKDSWGGRSSEQQAIDTWTKVDLLVIDELGASWGSESEQLMISEIMCERYCNSKRTILISNLNIEEIKETFDKRVLSRLREDAVLVVFDWEDERRKK